MIEEKYILLIHQSFREELSEENQLLLDQWLAEDPAHLKLLHELKKAWQMSKAYQATYTPDMVSGLVTLKQRIQAESQEKVTTAPSTKYRVLKQAFAIAASLLLLIAALAVWNSWFSPAELLLVTTGPQEQRSIELADGSTVVLNQNSSLEYLSFFREERQVQLSGEAFFDVAKNEKLPFIIKTPKTRTKVLGTSFNLRAYETESFTEVEVFEGIVQFMPIDETQTVKVEAGARGYYQHDRSKPEINHPKSLNSAYWKDNKLRFKGHSLQEAIQEINSRLNIQIEIANPALASCSFTLSVPITHPDTLVMIIAENFSDSNWEKLNSDSYQIKGGSCQGE